MPFAAAPLRCAHLRNPERQFFAACKLDRSVPMNPQRLMGMVTRLLDGAAVFALLVMMMLTTSDVVLRKLINKPILGVTELVELALGVAVFFAIPGVFARGANIAVDMIDQWRPAWSPVLQKMSALVVVIVLALFTWHMWQPMKDVIAFGDTSSDLQIPKVWFMGPAWAGMVVALAIAVVVLFVGEAKAEHAVGDAVAGDAASGNPHTEHPSAGHGSAL